MEEAFYIFVQSGYMQRAVSFFDSFKRAYEKSEPGWIDISRIRKIENEVRVIIVYYLLLGSKLNMFYAFTFLNY